MQFYALPHMILIHTSILAVLPRVHVHVNIAMLNDGQEDSLPLTHSLHQAPLSLASATACVLLAQAATGYVLFSIQA